MNSVYDTPEWAAWLASIREMPDDDNRRLIAADFLEDNGEGERAEFVRVGVAFDAVKGKAKSRVQRVKRQSLHLRLFKLFQSVGKLPWIGLKPCADHGHPYRFMSASEGPVEVEWSRGFVSRVSGPLGSLIGGRGCNRCVGGGREPTDRHGNVYVGECPDCNGTGRTPGVLRELVRREPVTAVALSDIHPDPTSGDMWIWSEEAFEQWPEIAEHFGQFAYDSQDSALKAMSDWLLKTVTEANHGSEATA